MKRLILIALLLSACNNTSLPGVQPPTAPPGTGQTGQTGNTLFGNALSKRSLSLDLFQAGGGNGNDAGNATAESSQNTAPGAPAPMPAADMAMGGRIGIGWFGGGEFNQYVLQFAEESTFAASSAQTLLGAYQQTVQPLLQEWDAQARLLESTAYVGPTGSSNLNQEIFFPDAQGKPVKADVRFMYRLASSERKETLVVYLTSSETRVHRLVWGESKLDLSQIKVDSNAARDLALKAFQDRSHSAAYPIYPESDQPEMQILYTVPATARWDIQLNQHSGQTSRYFVSVQFQVADANSPEGQNMAYGHAEIDAISGEIQSLNRPVHYRHNFKYDYAEGGGSDAPQPIRTPTSSVTPSSGALRAQ